MGFISRIIGHVRKATNEPSTDSKYSDDDILGMMEQAWPVLLSELNRLSKHPVIVKHTITLSSTTEYILPPHVGEVLWLVRRDSTTGLPVEEIRPRSMLNPYGPGVQFEGNILKLIPTYQGSSVDMELWYIPSGDISLIEGKIMVTVPSTDEIFITVSEITTGTADMRENAYAGYVLALTDVSGGNRIQERIISASAYTSDGSLLGLIVRPDFDSDTFTPADEDTFELVPLVLTRRLELAVCLFVAELILSYEESPKRAKMIQQKRVEVMRSLRLEASKYEARVGGHYAKDVIDNQRYGAWAW